jgi:cobalt/nickel transport system permease protein
VHTEIGLCPCGCVGRRRRTNYLAASLNGLSAKLHDALGADDLSSADGWLQQLDPRTKIIGGLALLIAVAFAHTSAVLLAVACLAALAAATSRIPPGRFLRRIWLTVPLFTALIALPATLDVVTPGPAVVNLGTWFGHALSVTAPGIAGAIRLVSRTGASISIVLLLTITTPWNRLLSALSTLRVPAMFVAVLAMAWRYVFLLTAIVTDLFLARRARAAGVTRGRDGAREGRGVIAATAGTTLARSHHLSGEVYQAMVARGYTGAIRTMASPKRTRLDLSITLLALVVAVSVVGVDRILAA